MHAIFSSLSLSLLWKIKNFEFANLYFFARRGRRKTRSRRAEGDEEKRRERRYKSHFRARRRWLERGSESLEKVIPFVCEQIHGGGSLNIATFQRPLLSRVVSENWRRKYSRRDIHPDDSCFHRISSLFSLLARRNATLPERFLAYDALQIEFSYFSSFLFFSIVFMERKNDLFDPKGKRYIIVFCV